MRTFSIFIKYLVIYTYFNVTCALVGPKYILC